MATTVRKNLVRKARRNMLVSLAVVLAAPFCIWLALTMTSNLWVSIPAFIIGFPGGIIAFLVSGSHTAEYKRVRSGDLDAYDPAW